MKKYCVVIPIYKTNLSDLEKLSIRTAYKHFNSNDIFVVTYKECILPDILKNANVKYFDKTFFIGIQGYNKLCKSNIFYSSFKEYEYMLIHQTDAYTLNNNMEYFVNLNYDYYGAPWSRKTHWHGDHIVGNGGYSLRKISKFIEITKNNNLPIGINEDDLYCTRLYKEIHICPLNIALQFAWETDNYDKKELPMGIHALYKHMKSYWDSQIYPILLND